jgi:hypothetical protein
MDITSYGFYQVIFRHSNELFLCPGILMIAYKLHGLRSQLCIFKSQMALSVTTEERKVLEVGVPSVV